MRIGLLFVLLIFSFPAISAERDLAWRLGFVRASVDAEVPSRIFSPSRNVDFDGSGIRFAFEARLDERLGFEFGWADFGSRRVDIFQTEHGSAGWAAFTRHLENGPLTLAAKLGAATATTDIRFSAPVEGLGEKAISTELFVGASVTYHLNDRAGVHLSLERFGNVATVVGLDYRHGWRASDAQPEAGLGIELLVGTASATPGIGSIRYPFSIERDVVVDEMAQPGSIHAVGIRVPYSSWLSFEAMYFPTSTASHYAIGGLDPEPPQPTMGPDVGFGVGLISSVEFEGGLFAARFEYEPVADTDLFVTLGALLQRESVRLRSDTTLALAYSENDTSTHPWLGVGARYRIFKAISLTVEVARADGENRSRAMVGWTF